MDLACERADWLPTEAARALLENNQPLLAYIGGKPEGFTSKDHIFFPGETISKQLILINNSRQTVKAECQWSLSGPGAAGETQVEIGTGQQKRLPISFQLPDTAPPGSRELSATVRFNNGETQKDAFTVDIIERPNPLAMHSRMALFDPIGETRALLSRLGVAVQAVEANADLANDDFLIIGKGALTLEGAAPDISRVKEGLKVLVFEQTSAVLEKRLGFRVEEYGLRRVFARIPDHPALAGLSAAELQDWRGTSTLLPPRLKYELKPRYGPTVEWAGLTVPHLWRCGNRGDVASVLIEKPAAGDFLPIVDGGFSLQFSPLLEYREGKGMVLFCQLDVTGRSENEPAADVLAGNLLRYVTTWTPPARRQVFYAGAYEGKHHLESIGLAPQEFKASGRAAAQLLVIGPGGAKELIGQNQQPIADWLNKGGRVLAVGLGDDELHLFPPLEVTTKRTEHISAWFAPFALASIFAGISPADLHNRDPKDFALISASAQIVGDGVLAQKEGARVAFDQMAPWQFSDEHPNTKRTHRRTSFALSRLLGNLGADFSTPLLERLHEPVSALSIKNRCRAGLYLDQPEEWDDPYRHFRW
jgi:hypothetical protein